MTIQEKYAAATVGATVIASASSDPGSLEAFEAEVRWLREREAAGHVHIVKLTTESHTGYRRPLHVVFKRLA